ncbi:MAG: DNA/RNA non-specific endonuclease, partial [Prevotella sp.]|nr:DNA/RNA non-specific endonuclease [Prevotella sp.]
MKKLLYLLLIPLAFVACSKDDGNDESVGGNGRTATNVNQNNTAINRLYGRLEFPHLDNSGKSLVVIHLVPTYGLNYAVEWDTEKHASRWSCYQMYNSNSITNTKRFYDDSGNAFSQYPNDASLSSRYHFTQDPYWGSGYDHGHMCPSADRLCSAEANKQTFYMTNMQPQVNSFNAGVLSNMEMKVRAWNNYNFRDTL